MAVYKEEKTGTWRVIYRYTDWNGERKQTQKRGFKTKRDAQAWEREQQNKATSNLDMTFSSFVEQYTADMRTRLKENTWATKEHIIRSKLLPYFGKLKMCNITAQQIITFAGAPKVGKSFLMAQLAYHVSTSLSLWGYTVHKGTVLYLALEDDHRRLQGRLYRMFGMDGTDNLRFAIYAKQLGVGLEEQLKKFVQEHSDTKLIIIDTLQKVREAGGDKYSYANDYEVVGKLKRLADDCGICLLLVHHTRKQQADDKFDMISGTNGLLGAADGAFLLQKEKRTDGSAILDVAGRDQQEQRLYLTKSRERLVWELERTETELWVEPPDPVLEAIAALITTDRPNWSGTATELVTALGVDLKPNTLTMRLNVNAGRLLNEHGIQYENSRSHAGRKITLKLIPPHA